MLKIRCRERWQASPPEGMRGRWTEWQVLDGRKVICRRDLREQCEKWLAENRPGEPFEVVK